MPDSTGAQFQEMLEVGVDVSVFESGLRQLEQVYADFLRRIKEQGGSSSEIFQAGAIGALSKDLSELTKVITEVQVNLSNTLKDITGGVVSTLESFEQTIEEKFVATSKSKIAQSKVEADERIEDAKRVNRALADEAAVGRAEDNSSFDGRRGRASTFAVGREEEQFSMNDAKAIGDMLALTLNAAKVEQDEYDKVVAAHRANEEKLAAEREELVLKDAKLQSELADKVSAQREALASKDAVYQSELADKVALRQIEDAAKLSKYREELAAKDAAFQSELAEKAAVRQMELDAQALRRRQEAEGQYMLNKGPQADSAPTGLAAAGAQLSKTFSKEGLGDILASVAAFSELFIVMGAAQLVIQALLAPFQEITSLIKSGWEYMTNLQKSAADLQGLIASNVVLSKDFTENFKLAGEAAVDITKQLQEISVQTGIQVTQLNSAFKAVVDGGGAQFVTQMSELGTLAEMFALAVKATGKDFQVQRTLISEIPSLLDGTVTKSSLILRTLGLIKEQWEKIREEGEKHHDLTERLAPLLEKYLTVAEQSDMRMASLNEKIDLMKNQISGAIMLPLWQAWIGILQEAANYLIDHKEYLIGIGQSVVGFISDLTGFIVDIVSLIAKVVLFGSSWSDVGDAILIVLFLIRDIIAVTEFAGKALERLTEMLTSPSKWFKKDEWKKVFDDITDLAIAAQNKIDTAAKQTAKGLDGSPDAASDKKVLGGKTPAKAGDDNLKQVIADYREETAAMKDAYSEQIKEKDKQLKQGLINEKQHHDDVLFLLLGEKTALQAINDEYRKKAELSGGKGKAITSFETSIDKTQRAEDHKDIDDNLKVDQQYYDFKKKLIDVDDKYQRDLIKQRLAFEIELAKESGSNKKELIARLEREAHTQAYEDTVVELSRELAATTTLEVRKEQIRKQLSLGAIKEEQAQIIATNKITLAGLADKERAVKEESAVAHANFNLEAARVNQSDKFKFNQREIRADQLKLAQDYAKLVNEDVVRLDILIEQAKAVATQTGNTEELLKLEKERDALLKEKVQADANAGPNNRDAHDATLEMIFGKGIDSIKEVFDDGFTKGVEGLTHAFAFFANQVSAFINAYKQGAASGGVLGGIGAVAGQAGGIVGSIPGFEGLGAAMQGVGAVMGIIGGIFKAQAKKIADEMKKSFDLIVKNYQNGTTNLMDTISQLEQKRQEAINRLSGKKGGQDELNKLLPQFDDEIASLKKAQTDLIASFENSLEVLRLHSDSLAGLLKTWQDINKQVKDYLGAGGDAAKAAEFLSTSLEKQRLAAITELQSGESQAIQDAISLNDLLKQRVDLVKQFKQQEFDLMNADSIERRQSGAVVRGTQLATLRAQNEAQLEAIDQQIDLATKKLSLEREVFNVTSDISALHRRDEELQLIALQTQVDKWKDIQTIMNGIVQTAAGSFQLSPYLAGLIGVAPNGGGGGGGNTTTITVNVGGVNYSGKDAGDIGQEIANAVNSGLQRALVM